MMVSLEVAGIVVQALSDWYLSVCARFAENMKMGASRPRSAYVPLSHSIRRL